MLLNLDMLGLFSVEFMACHVTAGWAPSVHIADGVKKSYSSLDVTVFLCPDVVCCGARCSHVVALYVVLSWWDGYPLQTKCIADAITMELCLLRCIVCLSTL